MSGHRPNLMLLFLRAMLLPVAAFAVWSVVPRLAGMNPWVIVAMVGGLVLFVGLLVVVYFVLPAVIRHLRRREDETEFGVTPPVCAHCGYDLRASPDHCPECGRPVDPLDRTIIQYLTRLRRYPADREER